MQPEVRELAVVFERGYRDLIVRQSQVAASEQAARRERNATRAALASAALLWASAGVAWLWLIWTAIDLQRVR